MNPGRNIKLVLGFDGTAYHGWQIQKSRPTVQAELAQAIRKITGEECHPVGCGRTDAGTHARRYVANFFTAATIPAPNLKRALNSLLPRDIRIFSAGEAPADFHARHSARSKIYRYQIYRGPVMPPHMAREHFHYLQPVNWDLMQQAAARFVGAHDFASFAARSAGLENTVRRIFSCRLHRDGHRLIFTVEGSGFLHHMVRNMVGTLLDVGRKHISMEEFEALFTVRDRTRAGFTAPAHGLILLRVQYGGNPSRAAGAPRDA